MIYAFETASKAFSMALIRQKSMPRHPDPRKKDRNLWHDRRTDRRCGAHRKGGSERKLDFIYRLKTECSPRGLHDDRVQSLAGATVEEIKEGGNDGLRGRSRVPDSRTISSM